MVKYKEAANVISFQLPVEVARRLELQGHCSLSVSLLCLVRLEERELLLSTHLKRLPELWSSLVSTLSHILAAFQRPHFFYKKKTLPISSHLLPSLMEAVNSQGTRWMARDASKSGVAQETIQNVTRRASKVMTEQEARQILGVTEKSTWEEIVQASVLNGFLQPVQKYDNLFERNAKNGSFYLQSKVHRAKECLESLHQPKDQGTAT
ncbi:protein Transporter, Pam16 [Actinidia rufa]|uniref:Protein Transporter, Pam16 n=1 Tax=Actinidia rufa TaxID=165716 RepID=A0A7J0F2L1_9ERIC|nr:protein Transporter, Pam16 [Actinidia rufa]